MVCLVKSQNESKPELGREKGAATQCPLCPFFEYEGSGFGIDLSSTLKLPGVTLMCWFLFLFLFVI